MRLLSLAVATVADRTGLVPAEAASGVMGTCTVVLTPLLSIPDELQLTKVPEVTQLKPLLVKEADTVILAGILRVKLDGPKVGTAPMLLTVTGKLLVCPTSKPGTG